MQSYKTITVQPDHCDPLFLLRELGVHQEYCALLESVDRHQGKQDYSYLALGTREVVTTENGDPLKPFEGKIGNGEEGVGLQMGYIGFVSYEATRHFDNGISLKQRNDVPDGSFFLPEVLLKIDYEKKEVTVITHNDTKGDLQKIEKTILASPGFSPSDDLPELPSPTLEDIEPLRQMSREEYCSAVKQIQEGILDGETFQVVLSQELQLKADLQPVDVYESLRTINPSPYMYYLQTPERTIVGASPETLIRVDGQSLTYRPIAGTRKRTSNEEENRKMQEELLADQKERCEHQMLVDLGRNDIGRVAAVGTVEVRDPFHIERYSHVYHIVSDIHAVLAKGTSSLDALRAVFPAGTLSGAPKLRSMETIAALEKSPRGIYGGALGYIDLSGNLDMAIVIRTMVFENNQIIIRAGAGIVKDSIPEMEDNECLHKAGACLAAVELAQKRVLGIKYQVLGIQSDVQDDHT